MRIRSWAACVLVAAAGSSSALGQSESCADAGLHPISLGVPFAGNFTGSTNDGPTGCGTTSNLTQWAVFTPAESGRYQISMCASAQEDTHLGLSLASAACSGAITYIGCNDDACGFGSQIVADLVGGETYRIRIGTFNATLTNGGGYAVLITRQSATAPANDDCSMAATASIGSNPGNNDGATGTNDNSCGGTADTNDIFYTFTSDVAGFYRFSACTGAFSPVISVHTACPASSGNQITGSCAIPVTPSGLAPLCSGRGASVAVSLDASQTVFVRIAGRSDQFLATLPAGVPQAGFGPVSLEVAFLAPPANDQCASAETITGFPFAALVDNSAATNSGPLGGCESFGDVWYTFTATSNGTGLLSETGGQDAHWSVYNANPCDGSASSIVCTGTDTGVTFPVSNGTTYWVRLGANFSTTSRATALNVSINVLPAPDNDDCANAEVVDVEAGASVVGNGVAATDEPFDVTCNSGTSPVARRGVWYVFTPSVDGAVSIAETSTNDTFHTVFTGGCDGLSPVLCSDPESSSLLVFGGETYHVLVGMWSPTTNPTVPYGLTFSFSPAPANDVCDDAETLDLVSGGAVLVDARAAQNDEDIDCNGAAFEAIAGVWYTFTTGGDGGVLNVNETSAASVATQLYTGDCNGLTPVAGSCSTVQNRNFALDANTTYYMIMSMSGSARPTVAYAFTYTFTPAQGACCVGGVCSITTQSACTGSYQGDGTTCDGQPQYEATGLPLPLADEVGGVPGVTEATITISETTTISALAVHVGIDHAWVGDISITLIGPGGSPSLNVLNRPGRTLACDLVDLASFGSANDLNGTYIFTDDAAQSANSAAVANLVLPSGPYSPSDCFDSPVSLNTTFGGLSSAGTWTLRVTDWANALVGNLNSFALGVNGGTPVCDSGPAPCPGNYNGDGAVDLLDLLAFNSVWSSSLGQNVTPGTGADLNNDGIVDLLDLLAFNSGWSSNLGNSCP